jgi:hypothetical protein
LGSYPTNTSLTTTLGSYPTNTSLTTTLGSYPTNTSLTSTLASYPTNTSLTSTLASYITSSSLITTLGAYASKSLANTFSALQTFTSGLTSTGVITANGGLTVASGQTLTLTGVNMIGPTPTVTFYSTLTTPYTIPAQTAMKVYFVFNGFSSSAIRFNLSDPGASYIGQSITIVNYNGSTGILQIGLSNVAGQGVGPGTTYNSGAGLSNTLVVNINGLANKTFTYIGTGAVNWVCG